MTLPTLTLVSKLNRDLVSRPFTYGLPIAQGDLKPEANLELATAQGKKLPVQSKTLETWLDGSTKWLLLSFEAPAPKNVETALTLVSGAAQTTSGISTQETPEQITVTTPGLTVKFSKTAFSLFDSYVVKGKEMVLPGSDITLELPSGKRFYGSNAKYLKTRITEAGPIKTVVESTGKHTAGDGQGMFSFRVRYTFFAGAPGVNLSYKFTNDEVPEAGVKIAALSLTVPTALGKNTTHTVRQSNTGKHWFSRQVEVKENVELMTAGFMNEAAKTRYGSWAEGITTIRDLSSLKENPADYPYFLRPGNARTDMQGGLKRTYPHMILHSQEGSALGFFFEMGFNYPKAVAAEQGRIKFDIWPIWSGDLLWRRGMSKEHDLYLLLSPEAIDNQTLEDVYFSHEVLDTPQVHLVLDPAYVRSTRVLQLHNWLASNDAKYLNIEAKLGTAGQYGETNYLPGNKGMMDFGDYINPDRSWAHNNEDDAILNHLREYYRLRAPSRLQAGLALARHNAHVDFIAFDPDPLRQGTMPAHCPEHTDGATYPSHMWGDGLLAAWCLTGEEDFKHAAISVAENMLRWQKQEPTIFYADSREAGWPALLYCRMYELTRDQKWLDAIQEVFEWIQKKINADSVILYELPHHVGTYVGGYGEFIAWRALYFYYELTGKEDVKAFLIKALEKAYFFKAGVFKAGWAANDMFPAWALYKLTGNTKYLKDNIPFIKFLMARPEKFMWGGNDLHFYLGELDRLGMLEEIARG
jgi:hypothetical protein